MANSVDPDQTAPIGAVCSAPTLFASILNSSEMLGNNLQKTTSADDIFRSIFFLRVKVFAYWVILHAFLSSADFFHFFLKKIFQVEQVWPDLGPNCFANVISGGKELIHHLSL